MPDDKRRTKKKGGMEITDDEIPKDQDTGKVDYEVRQDSDRNRDREKDREKDRERDQESVKSYDQERHRDSKDLEMIPEIHHKDSKDLEMIPETKKKQTRGSSRNDADVNAEMEIDFTDRNNHKVFYCTDHHSPHPFPPVAIITAPNVESAKGVLDAQLKIKKLKEFAQHPYTLREISLHTTKAFIIHLGESQSDSQ